MPPPTCFHRNLPRSSMPPPPMRRRRRPASIRMSNIMSVTNVTMTFSLVMSELGTTQTFSSGLHNPCSWEWMSPNGHQVDQFRYLPARFLTPNRTCLSSLFTYSGEERERLTLDEECNICYPYTSCERHNNLIVDPNGDTGAAISLPSGKQDSEWTYTRSIINDDAQAIARVANAYKR